MPNTVSLRLGLGVVGIIWFTSIPLAEAAFRLLGDHPTSDGAGMYMSFGGGSYKLRRSVHTDFNMLTGYSLIVTNGLGLRSAPAKRSETPRSADLLVLGDSQAFGWGLNYESTIAGQLARLCTARRLSVENAAVGGHHLLNQFEVVRWLDAEGFRPRRILVLLTPSLIARADMYNRIAVDAEGRLGDAQSNRPLLRATRVLKRNLVTYARVRNVIAAAGPVPQDKATPAVLSLYAPRHRQAYLTSALATVSQLRDWAAQRDISLTIAYAPLAAEFNGALEHAARVHDATLDLSMPLYIAKEVARTVGADFVDVTPALAGQHAAGLPLQLPSDSHYNEATSAACANIIFAELVPVMTSSGKLREDHAKRRD